MMVNFSNISKKKSLRTKLVIHDGVKIIEAVGVPLSGLTARRLEKMSMCLLALCGKTTINRWDEVCELSDRKSLRSRDIIKYINQNFEENISSGSYDDIRRKDLVRLVGMKLILKSADNPDADTNDGTRGYAVSQEFGRLIRTYSSNLWENALKEFPIDSTYLDLFEAKRSKEMLEVKIQDGITIRLDDGPHNRLQKEIIESFLPRFGNNATVYYIGDTSNKGLMKFTEPMEALGLDIEDRGLLPDIIAFSGSKKWLYLIEAVHTSNPFNPERCIELKRTVLKNCAYGVVFVTAFLSRKDFNKWLPQIAWETEVWLADTPDHLIHFNGDRFLGPHTKDPH